MAHKNEISSDLFLFVKRQLTHCQVNTKSSAGNKRKRNAFARWPTGRFQQRIRWSSQNKRFTNKRWITRAKKRESVDLIRYLTIIRILVGDSQWVIVLQAGMDVDRVIHGFLYSNSQDWSITCMCMILCVFVWGRTSLVVELRGWGNKGRCLSLLTLWVTKLDSLCSNFQPFSSLTTEHNLAHAKINSARQESIQSRPVTVSIKNEAEFQLRDMYLISDPDCLPVCVSCFRRLCECQWQMSLVWQRL